MAVVTISRQYGSGADEVAARVCDMLGYRYFDKGVMARMASEFGWSSSNIVDFSEEMYKVRGFLDRLRGPRVVAQTRTWTEDVSGRRIPDVAELDEEQAIRMVRSTVEAAYEDDNVVIVGRGGQAILKGKPGVLHVRIEAPMEDRVRRIRDQEGVDQRDAQRHITARDRAAEDYLKRFYGGIDWADWAQHYHVIINTGCWDTEAAAHLIVNAVSYLPPADAD